MSLKFIHIVLCINRFSFLLLSSFALCRAPHLIVHSLRNVWIFTYFDSCIHNCKHSCIGFCLNLNFHFILGKYPRSHIAGPCGKCVFSFMRNHQTNLCWCHFVFPLMMGENSNLLHMSALGIIYFVCVCFSHSNRCV